MESVVGGRGGVGCADADERQHGHSAAILELLYELQRETTEQALRTLSALQYDEQELLCALQRGRLHSTPDCYTG